MRHLRSCHAINRTDAMSIEMALMWAFGTECARLVTPSEVDSGGYVVGRDTIAVLMERKALGCAVQGGGRSRSADDAERLAEIVSQLPRDLGGFSMALEVASHARSGARPDPMVGIVPRPYPAEIVQNRHGKRARTRVVEIQTVKSHSKTKRIEVRCTPIIWSPDHSQINAARIGYIEWVQALRWIAERARQAGSLDRLRITEEMPNSFPWKDHD